MAASHEGLYVTIWFHASIVAKIQQLAFQVSKLGKHGPVIKDYFYFTLLNEAVICMNPVSRNIVCGSQWKNY